MQVVIRNNVTILVLVYYGTIGDDFKTGREVNDQNHRPYLRQFTGKFL
jgi:hypothetical protein